MTVSALDQFVAALVAVPARTLVGCDFDGTLAPIVANPMDSRPNETAVAALVALAEAGCQVCVVTGRPPAVAAELGDLARIPRLVILGHYGAQRWAAGRVAFIEPPAGLSQARVALAALAPARGVFLEDKGLSIALHTRQAGDPAGELARLRPAVEQIAQAAGLCVESGRLVLELREPGIDKGIALTRFTAEVGAGAVLFAGDDLGDLPAFAAVRAMDRVGLAVAVANAEAPEVANAADLVVDSPQALAELLARLAQLLE